MSGESAFWSGPGCEGNPAYEFDHLSDNGIRVYRKVGKKHLIGYEPGMVPVYKTDNDPVPAISRDGKKETTLMNQREAIDTMIVKMARVENSGDTEAIAVDKFLRTEAGAALYSLREVLGQVEKANVSFEKAAAHAMLEAHASTIRKADRSLSPEQAYCKALDKFPEIAAMAIGNAH